MNFKDLKVFCISLNRREDRRENIENRLKDLSIEFEFFDAIDGSLLTESYQLPKGAIGCNLSHMNLYRSLADYDKPILIIEDDAEFANDVIDQFNSIDIPDDWALLYFGGNHNGEALDMINHRIHRLKKTFTTHCFAINPKNINLNDISNGFELFYKDLVIDEYLAYHIQSKFPCYGIYPHISWQSTGFSDILQQDVNYSFLK